MFDVLEVRIRIPLNMLSLTIQSPANKRLSQGNCVKDGSDTSYTSPGTSSPLSTCRPERYLSGIGSETFQSLTKAVPQNPHLTLEARNLSETLHCLAVSQYAQEAVMNCPTDLVSIKVVVTLITDIRKMQIA